MMFRYVKLLCCSIIISIGCKAQNIDSIISKYLDAIGGKEMLAKVKTVYVEGEVMIPNSPLGTGKAKAYQVVGKNLREEMTFGTYQLVESYSAKGSWSVNPFLNKMKPGPMDEEPTNAGIARLGMESPLLDHSVNGSIVELAGRESINGIDAYKVKLVMKDGTEFTYLIDPGTFYILKRTVRSKSGQAIKTEMFSDYRKTDAGIVLPFASEFTVGPSATMYLIVNKIDINKDIDPSIFEMPKE
jgi:hypothetical protein